MKYLITVTETYRVDSEDEATALIEDAKVAKDYELSKYNCIQRCKKSKGEIIEVWYKVTLTKVFNDEKDPENSIIEVQS